MTLFDKMYSNLVHIFGFLGLVLAILSVIAVFFGNFIFALCILSLALGGLYLDKLMKE